MLELIGREILAARREERDGALVRLLTIQVALIGRKAEEIRLAAFEAVHGYPEALDRF